MKIAVVEKNNQGGYYKKGRSFSRAKWSKFIASYQAELNLAYKCMINCLTLIAKIGKHTAEKVISYYNLGFIPSLQKKTPKGVGSLNGLKMRHHAFVYALYFSNPALPNYGCCKEMQKNSASPCLTVSSRNGLSPSGRLKAITARPAASHPRSTVGQTLDC